MSDAAKTALSTAGTALLAGFVGFLVLHVARRALLRLGRRDPVAVALARRAHRPAQVVTALAAFYFAMHETSPGSAWHPLLHLIQLTLIGATGWLVAELLVVVEGKATARYPTDVRDNLLARRVHTQVMVIRRVTVVVIAVVALGAMLMTFPSARVAGRSLLFSAGVAGVVAAFAAQTLLGNALAGVQLAFSEAVRLDDVVVVQGQWGRVEEITLSYVAVRLWDDRRLIVPSAYLASNPFENWTRTDSAVMGTVDLDLDWSVPVASMREELRRICAGTALWDRRVGVLQVTDAVDGRIRVRALVSSPDAGSLWDLRCLVREHLVEWVRQRYPDALPRTRTELDPPVPGWLAPTPVRPRPPGEPTG